LKTCPLCSHPLETTSIFFQGRLYEKQERCSNTSCDGNTNPQAMQAHADFLYLKTGQRLEGWMTDEHVKQLSEKPESKKSKNRATGVKHN